MRCQLAKVLVTARGVVAVRIIRACKDLGFETVAVYDDADVWAPHAKLADEAYSLAHPGGYEDIEPLINVAIRSGSDAIHPGDGSLALDAAAAATVRQHGLTWIGASADPPIRRPTAGAGQVRWPPRRARVDLLAGTARTVAVGARVVAASRRGIPVATHSAPRNLADELRKQARAAAGELGLRGYAVAEFGRLDAGDWWFLGMSTRLTSDHAVIEEQTGVDIVAAQLALAFDPSVALPRPFRDDWAFGFAIEAEDRARGALRAGGVVRSFRLPSGPGVRVDSAIGQGQAITPSRDNRLAFVTVRARTEAQARERLVRAAREISVQGVATTAWLPGTAGRDADPDFTDATPDTGIVPLDVRGGGWSVRFAVPLGGSGA
ncbi:MAG: biotin carboxylase N-terminal domain-containing protein [Trebonia sp.]